MTTSTLRALAERLQAALDRRTVCFQTINASVEELERARKDVDDARAALRSVLAQPETEKRPVCPHCEAWMQDTGERWECRHGHPLIWREYANPASLAAPRAGERERLAALIRQVDGNHSLGAAALADALLAHVTLSPRVSEAGPDAALREAVEWLDGVLNKLHGALTFGINENGDTALWHGDDNDTPLGVGDTVEEALLDARTRALSGPRSER